MTQNGERLSQMGDRRPGNSRFQAHGPGTPFASAPVVGFLRPTVYAIAVVVAGASLAAFAPGTAPASPAAAGSSTASPAPRRPRVHSLVGEIVQVRPAEQKLIVRETLRDGSPKTTTFTTTPKTTVVRGADAATLADIRANDHVTIKYREDSARNKEAVSIRVTPSAAPRAPK